MIRLPDEFTLAAWVVRAGVSVQSVFSANDAGSMYWLNLIWTLSEGFAFIWPSNGEMPRSISGFVVKLICVPASTLGAGSVVSLPHWSAIFAPALKAHVYILLTSKSAPKKNSGTP